ncbi:S-adenosyl-l-methionine hydroxide adenosyltransferase family protein [Halorussus sp. MSC15.2]|uniref:SAM hydrolase/SAM-dependent halogenase family protein n=1 Tax=Halorussus sp. MSC15.2 TaxID=2283638 RepID=UPI0013D7A232|nr:SAM-dependent chlorinase/fluorinase [Halorussus sp. MSC15.2]NEU57438.1 SAM-dependent chlorinase/fluorinase [Halorussus sp. MSC15.2]
MITLTSDFGTPYPAAMKGVMLQRTDARLVDVGHDFPRQDVRTAAFWLREVLPYFPPAVHLVVVDPGVGTERAALAVRAGDHALVGPDNGVLLPAARELAARAESDDAEVELFEVEYDDADTESTTFHGRDVFAPAAAEIHEAGVAEFHERDDIVPTDEYDDLRFPDPELDGETAVGEILVVDGFGNAVTNLPGELLDGRTEVTANGDSAPVARAYAEVGVGERLVTVGSHGNVELAVNRGRGDEAFGVSVGDEVRIE